MKTKLALLLLVTVGGCMAQTNTNSGTNTKRPQRSFVGDVPKTVADNRVLASLTAKNALDRIEGR